MTRHQFQALMAIRRSLGDVRFLVEYAAQHRQNGYDGNVFEKRAYAIEDDDKQPTADTDCQ